MAPSPPQTWTADIGLRIRRHLALKIVGVTVFTWLFFIGYFHMLRHPDFAVTVMPLTALDHLIRSSRRRWSPTFRSGCMWASRPGCS